MRQGLNPIQLRRLVARTLTTSLGGGPAPAQLLERWAVADAPYDTWLAALTWDGIGPTLGWALRALDLREVAAPDVDSIASDAFEDAQRQCLAFTADLLRVGAEFDAAGVRAIALKGSALLIGNVVPSPGARWMGDLDVLVLESQAEQAGWALESVGYARSSPRSTDAPPVFRPYHETFTSEAGRALELHWRIGPSRWGPAAEASRWFERCAPSGTPGIALPAPADLFWHLLLHDARNHAWSSGSLRSAFDLALVALAPGFALQDVLALLDSDPSPEPLLEAVADAAHLSPLLLAEIEPSVEPRYLRLARWRDVIGRRDWDVHRVAEAVAWGATLDRARRFGGWRGVIERAVRIIPEAVPGAGIVTSLWRFTRNLRHAGFVGALALAHVLFIVSPPGVRSRRLANGGPQVPK